MKELRKAAGRALVALLQTDPTDHGSLAAAVRTALSELNVYKLDYEDGEPILTPSTPKEG